MRYSVEEKFDFNMRRMHESKDMSVQSFSSGYCMGVACYQGYGKRGTADMQRRRELINKAKANAQKGDLYSKGIMCGVRDAANERKTRQGK